MILKYPNPILRRKSEEIKEITPEIKELALDMQETMMKNKGIGLAASQIGILKRMIAIKTETGPEVFVNPKIIKKSKEKEIMEEGCLSFPEFFLEIKRPKKVEIEAINLDGKKVKIQAGGLLARVFQHEIDHLDGILFIDRLNLFQRIRIKKTLKKSKS